MKKVFIDCFFLTYQKWSSYNIQIYGLLAYVQWRARFSDVPYWHYKEMLVLHVFRPYIRNRNSSPFIFMHSRIHASTHTNKKSTFCNEIRSDNFFSKWRIASQTIKRADIFCITIKTAEIDIMNITNKNLNDKCQEKWL